MTPRSMLVAGLGVFGYVIATPAAAAESPPKCYTGPDFFVISRVNPLGPGTDILARRLSPEATTQCVFRKEPGDFEVSQRDEADYVIGLSGRFLVMDRGTGPDRRLVIYDLAARKSVLVQAYDTSSPVRVEPDGVAFSALTGPASVKTCPQLNELARKGLGAAMAVEMRVALPALTRTRSGTPHCVATQ